MAFSPYNSPIDPALYPTLALMLMIAGLASSAFFFVQQVTTSKVQRSLSNDMVMATVSAVFMGLGMMFTMLTVGIYV
jgi:hypothetical protein